jgi:hypothetical protein
MKNKKVTYILIPAVVLIWGLIFYKFIKGFSGDEDPVHAVAHLTTPDSVAFLPDTFSLHAAYRDPFLGKQLAINTAESDHELVTTSPKVHVAPAPLPVAVVTPWPVINYGGVIKSMKSDKQVAIITIDGKEYLFKQGDLLSGMQIIAVFKDSVKLKRDKELKTFRK